MLNKLLNEMDGLREDAQITFLLTTNRPEDIEPAIVSRPGRVDQAIAIALPDADRRRRLLALYGREVRLGEAEMGVSGWAYRRRVGRVHQGASAPSMLNAEMRSTSRAVREV